MHPDAKITLYGGFAIGIALVLVGALSRPVITHTGFGITAASMAVAFLFDYVRQP